MILRKSKKGEEFYGCSRYPKCKSTLSKDKMKTYLEELKSSGNLFSEDRSVD